MVEAASIRSRQPVGLLLLVLAAMFAIVLWATVTASPSAVTMPTIGFAEAIAHKQALNQERRLWRRVIWLRAPGPTGC